MVLPTVFVELTHLLVRSAYQPDLRRNKTALIQEHGPLTSWSDLLKHDASILQQMAPVFSQLRRLLTGNQLFVVDPERLNPVISSIPFDSSRTDRMCHYGLDSNDALILMEAQRVPVLDIATLDVDLRRAQADFTIYTWL